MTLISIVHKEHGFVRVDEGQWKSSDNHGWAEKDAKARGWKVATEKEIEAELARIAALAAKEPASE